MAERRMFAKSIIDSDAFLEMPISSRLLYYDLAMRADDDGFNNSPKKVMRTIGATNDDMNILITRKFIIPFENGVVVIKHWRIHNYIRKDMYHETKYKDELGQLSLDRNNAYTLQKCNELVTSPSTQVRLGKDSIGKDNKNINMSDKSDDDVKKSSQKQSKQELTDDEKLQRASEENFNLIYAIYPKKVGKAKALEHYYQWRKGRLLDGKKRVKLSNNQIYLAVQNYVEQQRKAGKDIEYWKNFDTLMNKSLLDYVVEEQDE